MLVYNKNLKLLLFLEELRKSGMGCLTDNSEVEPQYCFILENILTANVTQIEKNTKLFYFSYFVWLS